MYRQAAENTNKDTKVITGYLFTNEKSAEKKLFIDFMAKLYTKKRKL